MRRILTAFLLFGCSLLLTAQTMEQFIEDAIQQDSNKNYFGAYDSYRIASEFDDSRLDLRYKMADMLRLYTAYDLAYRTYKEVETSDQAADFPELQFRMGQTQQFLGNYDQAIIHYTAYLERGASTAHFAEAQKGLADSNWAQGRKDEGDDITPTHLPRDINSEYSDFAYRPDPDSLLFSSNRVKWEEDPLVPPRYLTRIFRVMREGSTIDPGRLSHRPTENQLHMAHTTFNTDRNRVYYTMCEYVGPTEIVRCDLFYSDLQEGSAKWGAPTKMAINLPAVSSTQPHVAVYKGTGQETLFFSSNRPGGQGGMDLYMAPLNDDGTAGEVTPLTEINTAGDDVTPFYDSRVGRLYFSTDGRQTMGGQDVYSVSMRSGEVGEPVHLDYPVNGSWHDRYYIISRQDTMAYFSSNRQSPEAIRWHGDTTNACCDDIYSVPFDESILLEVLTFRDIDKTDLDRADVSLTKINEDGTRELLEVKNTELGNKVTFTIYPGMRYEVNGKRVVFGPVTEVIDLTVDEEIEEPRVITLKLFFPQLLIAEVYDAKTKEPINGARVRLANQESGLASPLFDKTNENGNRFDFLVRLDRPYYVHAEKGGYTPADSSFTVVEANVNENGEYLVKLYLSKPEPLDLVPLNVYFDNDLPHKNSRRITSDVSYDVTNQRYNGREEAFVADLSAKAATAEDKLVTEELVRDFFENDVRGGMRRLEEFAGLLLERLKIGARYTMFIEGNASKRGNPSYNLNLSKRRVDSVMDYFRAYGSGELAKYIESGALSFEESYAGESKAQGDESIYQLEASRSRRVTITDLKEVTNE